MASFRISGPTPGIPLDSFQKLTDDQLETLISVLGEIDFPASPESRRHTRLLDLVMEKLPKIEIDVLNRLLGTLVFVLGQFDDYDDFRGFIGACLEECQDPSTKNRAEKFFESLSFRQYFYNKRLGRYSLRANNYYGEISYACDLRGRFDRDYNYDDISVDDYKPELVDVTPIVTLMIELHDGSNDQRVWFQADVDDLDEMIGTLLAAQKELNILTQFAKRGNDEKE